MVVARLSEPRQGRLTVYFDGSCSICVREIAGYRRLCGARCIDWIDVTSTFGDLIAPGLSRKDALGRFHVIDETGQVFSGGAAFAALWTALPAFSALGRLCSRWPFDIFLERIYRVFLLIRPRLQTLYRICTKED